MAGGRINEGKRLRKPVDDPSVKISFLLLKFKGTVLPERLKVGCLSFLVKDFVPPPL